MNDRDKDRIECAIRHIQSSLDVDPWAMNIAVEAMKKQLEIVRCKPEWIPCSVRLPEEPYGCLVTVWDTNPITMDEFENILPYFVGWDGEQWNDADGEQCPFEVIAWMPLPEPYRGEKNENR